MRVLVGSLVLCLSLLGLGAATDKRSLEQLDRELVASYAVLTSSIWVSANEKGAAEIHSRCASALIDMNWQAFEHGHARIWDSAHDASMMVWSSTPGDLAARDKAMNAALERLKTVGDQQMGGLAADLSKLIKKHLIDQNAAKIFRYSDWKLSPAWESVVKANFQHVKTTLADRERALVMNAKHTADHNTKDNAQLLNSWIEKEVRRYAAKALTLAVTQSLFQHTEVGKDKGNNGFIKANTIFGKKDPWYEYYFHEGHIVYNHVDKGITSLADGEHPFVSRDSIVEEYRKHKKLITLIEVENNDNLTLGSKVFVDQSPLGYARKTALWTAGATYDYMFYILGRQAKYATYGQINAALAKNPKYAHLKIDDGYSKPGAGQSSWTAARVLSRVTADVLYDSLKKVAVVGVKGGLEWTYYAVFPKKQVAEPVAITRKDGDYYYVYSKSPLTVEQRFLDAVVREYPKLGPVEIKQRGWTMGPSIVKTQPAGLQERLLIYGGSVLAFLGTSVKKSIISYAVDDVFVSKLPRSIRREDRAQAPFNQTIGTLISGDVAERALGFLTDQVWSQTKNIVLPSQKVVGIAEVKGKLHYVYK